VKSRKRAGAAGGSAGTPCLGECGAVVSEEANMEKLIVMLVKEYLLSD